VMRRESRWWIRLLQGLLSIAAGVAVFIWPGLTVLVMLYVIAFYLVFAGIFQMIASIEFRKVIKGEVLLMASGILSLIVGVLLFLRPFTGAIALAQTLGIFAVAYGVMLAILAFKLRHIAGEQPATTAS